jgi:RNA-binding protein
MSELPKEGARITLTAKQRAHLRSLAHHLKPVFYVGKEGITEAAIQAIRDAFNTRELLKVKVQEAAPVGVRDGAELLGEGADATVVQTIGRTAVLYRRHPTKPEIKLPG